ncbi:hypothetical protein PTE30175_00297 [Pandoraea terrae]|uniref:Uncharacterized protein n=1 Tax=Pandoraea terrae TaxID=1537710 RepID=A0A5E4RRK1_9BURK|nr:hypothetical protein [Pandoraea terrae]VVD65032.1 hypothetical protein PTE30175_00297 [Pandoraea terrae]
MSEVQRQLSPEEDEAITEALKYGDAESLRLNELTSRIVALSAIGSQGTISSLDENFISAFFEQMEELATEAYALAEKIGRQRRAAKTGVAQPPV